MKKPNVAILGATGAVGQEFLTLIEERKFPFSSLKLLASKRSAGKKIKFMGKTYTIEEAKPSAFEGLDLVLSSAGGSVSLELVPHAVKAGALVVDNTSAFRMDSEVPLVIPEINPEDIKKHKGVIANPNCSAIIMLMAIAPLHKKNRIQRVLCATYQAVSGAGAKAMEELEKQTQEFLAKKPLTKEVFPHQIAFNLFSHNAAIERDGYNSEELKMIQESHKILHDNSIKIVTTCVRVPVLRAHTEVLYLEFEKPMKPEEAREILSRSPGLRLQDDEKTNHFPMPIEATGREEVLVGRIRKDLSSENGLALMVSGDQLWKGAALNAVQIAEVALGLQKTENRG
ncbi:MAG: aspartate-semialdehyde dehydrogenase [Candidatus Omnitrophica bacterium]|nr:aspartate-semialdehyde dehydrogenase [Candidatus Omnitrophota bacterium]